MRKVNKEEEARKTLEIIKKLTNVLVKFQALVIRKADKLLWDIPAKADKGGDEKEVVITFLIMPRDAQGSDTAKHFTAVIVIGEVPIMEGAGRGSNTEDFQVVFIFRGGEDTLCLPKINNGIGDHASIAASTSSAERMCMVNEELTRKTLDDEPRFVRR